jgi:hypothetical protein
MTTTMTQRPGLHAPALFLAALGALVAPAAVRAQPAAQARPPLSNLPVPSELELAKMIWSTMAMVDQANRSGNYSVMRDTGATGFQIQNDPSRLAEIFAPIRQSRVDLSNALIVAPTYTAAPRLLESNVFEVKGYFPLRPTPIYFDLFFQWQQGRWKLFGISLVPGEMVRPGQAPAKPPTAPAKRK